MRTCKHNDYGECLECALERVSAELDDRKAAAARMSAVLEGHYTGMPTAAMSDTPETDAEEEICNGDPKPVYEFARRLERERNAEVERSARLVAELHESNRIIGADAAQITLVSAERDALRSQVAVLRGALMDMIDDKASLPGKPRWNAYAQARAALNSTAETK